MKTIELFIMLIGVTFGISKFAYGQVYSPNTYIYEDISGDDWYILLKLAGDKAFMDAGYALNGFRRYDLVVGYRRSSSWADDQNRWSHRPNYEQKSENHNLVFHYNANMSSKYSKI